MKLLYFLIGVSIGFLIVDFIIPPFGIIDDSVLAAVELLLEYSVIVIILKAIKEGRNVKIKIGDVSAEVDSIHN